MQYFKAARAPHEIFFVSKDTTMSRGIAAFQATVFITHFALGQARFVTPLEMTGAAFRNFWQSAIGSLRQRANR